MIFSCHVYNSNVETDVDEVHFWKCSAQIFSLHESLVCFLEETSGRFAFRPSSVVLTSASWAGNVPSLSLSFLPVEWGPPTYLIWLMMSKHRFSSHSKHTSSVNMWIKLHQLILRIAEQFEERVNSWGLSSQRGSLWWNEIAKRGLNLVSVL